MCFIVHILWKIWQRKSTEQYLPFSTTTKYLQQILQLIDEATVFTEKYISCMVLLSKFPSLLYIIIYLKCVQQSMFFRFQSASILPIKSHLLHHVVCRSHSSSSMFMVFLFFFAVVGFSLILFSIIYLLASYTREHTNAKLQLVTSSTKARNTRLSTREGLKRLVLVQKTLWKVFAHLEGF